MGHEHKILIVDDNVENVELLDQWFSAAGYRVVTAYDGVQAMERIGAEEPDIVILDVIMPRMDGFEVCDRIKSDPQTRRIPVILLTARNEVPDKVRGFNTGADDYVTKPFSPQELNARVDSLLERRSTQRKIATAEKLGALGQMAEGVAHEVRNPMLSIGGFARRIHKSLPEEDPLREYAGRIIYEVERLERMVNGILRFKTLMAYPFEPVDLGRLIRKTAKAVEPLCRKNGVTVVLELPEEPVRVSGEAENLQLALTHLATNGAEAMEEGGGTLTVRLSRFSHDYAGALVEVEDTGCGILRDDLSHVFDPFFTAKPEGAGIGLTLVHQIVTRHGGEVEINSEEGIGTIVRVRLPRSRDGGR